MTLFCAEPLRPAACCVEDALVTRGWTVGLQTGPSARLALRRLLQTPDAGMLVLCVPEAIDRGVEAKLRAGLDPEDRGELHIIPFDTPRGVIEAVERLAGIPTRHRPRHRPRRAVLAEPTLVEQAVVPDRWRGYGMLGAAAVLAVAALGVSGRPSPPPAAKAGVGEPRSAVEPSVAASSPLLEDVLFSNAVRRAVPVHDTWDRSEVRPRPSRRSRSDTRSERRRFQAPDETPADVEHLPPAPLEDSPGLPDDDTVPTIEGTATPSVRMVPGVPVSQTIGPFARIDAAVSTRPGHGP